MDNNKAYVLRGKLNANIEPLAAPGQPGPNGKSERVSALSPN